ncbi:MAG TPA: type II toxin-antitoxin system VapC family toxin [Chitinophagales bacterium]|jgi:predicted nucleic acid-binding protein|nr:type II toxin-antitoxin system VapC family toxin [Chitinophagales bacterium]MBP6154297.1 type II toxin-antitoxin system VapC family toxin [Chitinophagales bacterium]HQV77200.1 type II toxin-antitoxin system VapC family toxin [Chitinophagales bacterium]HQW79699.1 type II toxin-antitoxin system VapC family toxin [Chitinophagales bacterium]HRB67642.1 type II toxin-antitoxin system VapC family toxin [Chitinophagales bacterium]
MGKNYLIDTNVIIDFAQNKLPKSSTILLSNIIDNEPKISVINKIELLGFTNTTKQIIAFVKTATVFDLDEVIVNKTIELRKKHKIKLPDAIIASTAIIHKLTLITHNVNDFKNIKNLKVQDSFLL